MKKRNLIYIAIIIICVVAIFAGVYYEVFKERTKNQNIPNNEIVNPAESKVYSPEELKDEFNSLFTNTFNDQGYKTSSVKRISGLEDKDVIYTYSTIKEEIEEKYNIDINLPVFNVSGDVATEFNKTTQTIFINKANNIITNSNEYTIYNLEYVAYLNDNILSLVIKSTLKEGNSAQRIIVQTYNYDISTGKSVTLNDILEAKGISTKDVNEKIEKQVTEANKQAEAISQALAETGQTVYKRDVNNAMYVTDNVSYFFIGLEGQIYIIYPYGNSSFTSEMDIIKI